MDNDDRRCTGDDAEMGNEGLEVDGLRVTKLTIIVNVRTNSALKPLLPDACSEMVFSIERADPKHTRLSYPPARNP